ncbi:MAG TPA: hypothetical protein VGG13_00365 [Candidatus Saccharimonadales bacterium]
MLPFSFYSAFIATALSMTGLTYLAWKKYTHERPLPISQLGASSRRTLLYFRMVLWTCGTLFAISFYFFIATRISHSSVVLATWTGTFICELALGIFPAYGEIRLDLHNACAFLMACGFVALTVLFSMYLKGAYATIELGLAIAMVALDVLAIAYYKTRFIFYELPSIYLSHISILIAVLVLR